MKHGLYARSPSALEVRGRKVARLMRRLRVVAPWLEPSDESTARAYCELEILSAAVFAALTASNGAGVSAGVTKLTPDGRDLEVRRLVDAHRQMKQTQLAYARELGLTPLARMAIKTNGTRSAFDLPAEMLKNVTDIGESRAAERAERRKNVEDDEDGG